MLVTQAGKQNLCISAPTCRRRAQPRPREALHPGRCGLVVGRRRAAAPLRGICAPAPSAVECKGRRPPKQQRRVRQRHTQRRQGLAVSEEKLQEACVKNATSYGSMQDVKSTFCLAQIQHQTKITTKHLPTSKTHENACIAWLAECGGKPPGNTGL